MSVIIFNLETSIMIANSGYCQRVGDYIKYCSNNYDHDYYYTCIHTVHVMYKYPPGLENTDWSKIVNDKYRNTKGRNRV